MKSFTDHEPGDLEHPFVEEEERKQTENISEKKPDISENIFIPLIPESEVDPPGEITRRAMERYRKGIFACPRLDKFFEDDDDVKLR